MPISHQNKTILYKNKHCALLQFDGYKFRAILGSYLCRIFY